MNDEQHAILKGTIINDEQYVILCMKAGESRRVCPCALTGNWNRPAS